MPDPCNTHGFCYTADGSCRCDPGWIGPFCADPAAVTVTMVMAMGEGCAGFALNGSWTSASGEGWSSTVTGCVRNTECSTSLSSSLTLWSSTRFTYLQDGRGRVSFYTTHNCTGDLLDIAQFGAVALQGDVEALDDCLPDFDVDISSRIALTEGLPTAGAILRDEKCYETTASVLGDSLNHLLATDFGARYNTLIGPCLMADFTALEEERQRSRPCGSCLAPVPPAAGPADAAAAPAA